MSVAISSPYPIFFSASGDPLNNGYLYFGQANLDGQVSPVTVYWDAAGTSPVPQPVRTKNGMPYNGVRPAQIFANGEVSIKILDQDQSLVNFVRSTKGLSLSGDLSGSTGAGLIGYDPSIDYGGSPGSIGAFLGKKKAVFATGVATVDCDNIQNAINQLPVGGVLDLFGDFQTNRRIFLKPQITINNMGCTITHSGSTDLFSLCDDLYGSGGPDTMPAGMIWTGDVPLATGVCVDAFPGRININGLKIYGPLVGDQTSPDTNEVVGVFTRTLYAAAFRIECNGQHIDLKSNWVQGFGIGASVACAGFAVIKENRLISCKIGVMLFGDSHASELDNWCEFCFIGTGINYGNTGSFIHGTTIGGVYQSSFVGFFAEGAYESNVHKSLYFEGNRWRDIQIGWIGGRQCNGFNIPTLNTSSACNNKGANPSVTYQYTRELSLVGDQQQGTNVAMITGINVTIGKAYFNSGSPSGTRWNIHAEASGDNLVVEIGTTQSSRAVNAEDEGRVTFKRGGRQRFGMTKAKPFWSWPFAWGDISQPRFGAGHNDPAFSASAESGIMNTISYETMLSGTQKGLFIGGKDGTSAFTQLGGGVAIRAALFRIMDASGSEDLMYVRSGKIEWSYQYGQIIFSNKAPIEIQNKYFQLTGIQASPSYANDAAAAADGVNLGQVYRNGTSLQIRMV